MSDAVDAIVEELRERGDPDRAAFLSRFFRADTGGYGEGDRFLGVPVPQQRLVARAHRDLPLHEVARLLASPWHDARFVAVAILVERSQRARGEERADLMSFYLRNRDGIDNWDLVDASAPHVLGVPLAQVRDASPLRELAASPRLWDRRMAILASWAFTKRGDASVTLDLAQRLLADPHDLMHKAVGWMLREVGKRDEPLLLEFLDAHAREMPRTALRYATERLDEGTRSRYIVPRRRARPR